MEIEEKMEEKCRREDGEKLGITLLIISIVLVMWFFYIDSIVSKKEVAIKSWEEE